MGSQGAPAGVARDEVKQGVRGRLGGEDLWAPLEMRGRYSRCSVEVGRDPGIWLGEGRDRQRSAAILSPSLRKFLSLL